MGNDVSRSNLADEAKSLELVVVTFAVTPGPTPLSNDFVLFGRY
jgi:hypothetical protein